MKRHDGRLARGVLEVQVSLVYFRDHLREGPFKQGVGVRQNGRIFGSWFLWWNMVNRGLKRGPGRWRDSARWAGWRRRWRGAINPRSRGCGRRCCLCRLRLRLCLGLLPGRQLCCICVVGPLPGRARLHLQLQVLRLHRLVQLPVTVNPGLERVVEQFPSFTIAAVPQNPNFST
jgi:hypothetical protein